MNENHNHNKALEDAIERLVHGKKASGNELLDMLGASKPKAEPSFMSNLEERLMAELSSKEKGIKMEKRKEIPSKFGRWPLTMAAAVMAIIVVGGLLFFMQAKNDDSASGTVMNPVTAVVAVQAMIPGTVIEADMVELRTFTPDRDLDQVMLIRDVNLVIGRRAQAYVSVGEPLLVNQVTSDMNTAMVPVVIAIQDIPEGTEITPDRVAVILFPADNAPSGAFASVEDVVGYVTATTIYTEEIVLVRKLLDQSPIDDMEATVAAIEMTATAQAVPYVPVVIAIQDIPVGTEITRDRVSVMMLPAANAPSGAFASLSDVIGMTARADIYTEEIILARKITETPFDPTPDQFALTATAIVQTATASASETCPEPTAPYIIYEVQEGDTIYSIASEHNVRPVEILDMNCHALPNIVLNVGDSVRIPTGTDIDPFALTATAIIATATASASEGIGEPARVIPNAPEVQGCNNDNALILYPLNGQLLDRPVLLSVIANNENFFRSTIEISGPGTNDAFVVIQSISQPAIVETEIGQFVPDAYRGGEYKLRLNTFNNNGNQVGTCTITVYLNNAAATSHEVNLRPVVIAVQDIPMNTVITSNMVILSYWPDEVALDFATDNSGQWYMGDINGVVGMMSTDFIPAYQPISSNLLMQDIGCECAILPPDKVAIIIENADNSVRNLVPGQRVDVIIAYNYLPLDDTGINFQIADGEGELALQHYMSNLQVIWVGAFPEDGNGLNPENTLGIDITTDLTNSDRLVTLAVTPAQAELLQSAPEEPISIMVVPHLEGAESTAP